LIVLVNRGCPGNGRAKLPLSRIAGIDARLGRSLAFLEIVNSGVSNSRTLSVYLIAARRTKPCAPCGVEADWDDVRIYDVRSRVSGQI